MCVHILGCIGGCPKSVIILCSFFGHSTIVHRTVNNYLSNFALNWFLCVIKVIVQIHVLGDILPFSSIFFCFFEMVMIVVI